MKTKLKALPIALLINYATHAQWTEQLFTGYTFEKVYFFDELNGRAVSKNAEYMYSTKDGGITWNSSQKNIRHYPCVGNVMTNFLFEKEDLIVGVKCDGARWITKNNGLSYFRDYNIKHDGQILKKYIFDNKIYFYSIGSPILFENFCYKSNSLYGEVTTNPLGLGDIFADFDFADSLVGYAGTDKGNLRKTIDGGKTWRATSSGTDRAINAVKFLTPASGFVIGDGGYLGRTIDGGKTFTSVLPGVGVNFYSIVFPSKLIGYVVGSSGAVYKTTDGGMNWEKMVSNTFETLYSISCPSPNVCYAVGTGGVIMKYTDEAPTSISAISENEQFELYPNPATSQIFISNKVSTSAPLNISIYNALGSKIEQLSTILDINGSTLDVSQLPRGLYTVCIEANGKKLSTKRVALL